MDVPDDESGNEVFELDADQYILVEVSREWPRYVATWSIRRRAGETDFPMDSGRVEQMPPADPAELDAMLSALRDEARQEAIRAAKSAAPTSTGKGESFLGRLFGRK